MFSTRESRESMATVVQENVLPLHEIFHHAVDKGESLDLFQLFNKFTFEVIAKIAFGVKLRGLTAYSEHPVETAFNYAQQRLFERLLEPTWWWKLMRWLDIGEECEFKKHIGVIDTSELIYLEAVLKETLRLYPAVPGNIREALRDVVHCDGTVIKAGETASWSSYALGRMEHVWGPDAKEFKPER
ncbi:unnamed protein product [Phytophthora fragariaefolia]|uniref:Unnamed protein product n=1 Tax=Phytophthora fragariaefolia TaxID=1490495 RepID=A0A9W6YN62_9STRA|nr:unnamed protein product [Phytophthora fragariaefolia]